MTPRDRSASRYRAPAGGLAHDAPTVNEADARVLFEAWAVGTGWRGPGWDDLDERERNYWRRKVRS
jgi:hypothetical protein